MKNQNLLTILNLGSAIRVSMIGLEKEFDSTLVDAILLWKNGTKFWYLFSNLEKYFAKLAKDVLEEGENLKL